MNKYFEVVLKGNKEKGQPQQYFTNNGQIVDAKHRGQWKNYNEAASAAKRARIQDTLNRVVVVEEI